MDTDETVDKERIFVMSKLTDQNIRSRLQQGELAIHNNFEDGNKPAYAFQMAKNKTESGKGNQGDPFTITTWERVIRSTMATAVGAKIIPRKKTKETKVFGEHLIKGK